MVNETRGFAFFAHVFIPHGLKGTQLTPSPEIHLVCFGLDKRRNKLLPSSRYFLSGAILCIYLNVNSQDAVIFGIGNYDGSPAITANSDGLAGALPVDQVARNDVAVVTSRQARL